MGIEDKFKQVANYREQHKLSSRENYQNQSRRRLQKIVETKINTTMIGSISAIEQKFGKLWGQGKPASQLTDQELEMLALKDELRTEILNLGNNQKRAAVAEINQYDVEWKRHHMDLHVMERREKLYEEGRSE
jgi:hypothetical protein